MYIMSEKATGQDWKKNLIIPTLRHAAGCSKYTINPIKSKINNDGSLKIPKKSIKNYKLVEKLYNVKTKDKDGVPVIFI